MSFQLNLLDVEFVDKKQRSFDSLKTNSDSRELYSQNLRYPLDLGTTDKAHYALFTIYEQQITNFKGQESSTIYADAGNGLRTGSRGSSISQGVLDMQTLTGQNVTGSAGQAIGNAVRGGIDIFNGAMATVSQELAPKVFNSETLRNGINTAGDITKTFVDSAIGEAKERLSTTDATNFNRRIKRISESIALYLPDSLNFGYAQGYADTPMYSGKMGLGATAISALDQIKRINSNMSGTDIAKEVAKIAGTNLTPFLSYGLGNVLGAPGSVIAAEAFGGVQNPMLELIYTSPNFREFQFDFMFYPRSVKESEEVWNIINSFKFHSAPEIKPGNAGYFLIPPSIFNIEFFYNGTRNQNLPLISDCVLTSIDVDYAPQGWSAYEVPGQNDPYVGGTGAPVAIRMTMRFKETVILTKGLHLDPRNSKERVNR